MPNLSEKITETKSQQEARLEEKIQIELMKKKAEYYFELKTPIHLTLNNRLFLNGSIKEIRADFFLFEENERGEIPVFFLELWDIVPYNDKRRSGDGVKDN